MAKLKEKSLALLSATTVSLAAVAATTLYTVPVGKRCVLAWATLVAAADTGASVLTIGQVGALTDWLPAYTLATSAQYDAFLLQPVPNATALLKKSYAAGTVIQIDVTTGSGAAGNTVYLFGFLY